MLGGSVAVAALGLLGDTPQDSALARFAGVALLALGGVVAAVRMAPRTLRMLSETDPGPRRAASVRRAPATTS
jgi:hypothetical protein